MVGNHAGMALRRRFDWRDRHFRESGVFFAATRLLLPMHGADAMRQQSNKRLARGLISSHVWTFCTGKGFQRRW